MSKELSAVIFMKENSDLDDIEEVKKILEEKKIKEWRFIDSETALKEFEKKFPGLSNLISGLKESPFPPTFELKMEIQNKEDFYSLERTLKQISSVEQIQNSGDFSREISSVGRVIVLIGMFFSSILFVASTFTIFNTIRLNLVYYKDVIEILRLVGASLSFVRIPFYLLAFFLGFSGGFFSLIVLIATTKLLLSYVSPFISIIKGFFPFVFLPISRILQIMGTSVLISLFTSWISINTYIK